MAGRYRVAVTALVAGAVLALVGCSATPAATPSSGSTKPSAAASSGTAAASTVTVSCEEFNSAPSIDAAFEAINKATGGSYNDAADHSLLQGAQNACSMDMTRSLNDVMTELTGGQVVAAPSDEGTDNTGTSNGNTGADAVVEACGFGTIDNVYTVEILADFPDVWKSDAPLPTTGGNAVCYQKIPNTAQVDHYWVRYADEQAGEAPALAWDAALTGAGYTKTCRTNVDIAHARAEGSTAICDYVNTARQVAMIEFNGSIASGWMLWFMPQS